MSSAETFDFAFTNWRYWPETILYLFLKDPQYSIHDSDHTLELFIQNLGVFDNF